MTEQEPQLWVEIMEERTSSRLRETFLLSVIVHLLVVLVVITNPDLFEALFRPVPVVIPAPPKQDVTLLYQPPELPKLKLPPPTRILSDANRKAQPGVEQPVSPPIEYRAPAPPPPKPPGSGQEQLTARGQPPVGLPDSTRKAEESSRPKPSLEPVKPAEPSPSRAQLTLPSITSPGRGTEAILREMARRHAAGDGGGLTGGYPAPDSQDLDFNLPGPQILSDTMGVDFNPYLLRVYQIVRRNWYSVIPEIARLGRRGKVMLEFSIVRDGRVPDLVLRVGSGTDSLDSAAMASIRLSNPFPALPAEFPGANIRLRFAYFYNIPIE